jgi:N-acetylneuraminate synthase
MKKIKINNKTIYEDWPVFVIAELGINHNGDVELAKKLIDIACICGCDAVKFQKRTPELCVPENKKNEPKETPWGKMTYLEYRKHVEFGKEQYKVINKYCQEKNIIWFASPWDLPSLAFLEEFEVPCYKIPSAMLTNKKLLKAIQKIGKPTLLSTGMSTIPQIDKAISSLKQAPLIILHCNSSYPSEASELNLTVTTAYKKRYPKHIIGYSGHEKGYTASLVAAVLGARVIERHITLDRAMWGTDQAASLEFDALRRLVRDLSLLPIWMGDGQKKVYPSELIVMEKLRIPEASN